MITVNVVQEPPIRHRAPRDKADSLALMRALLIGGLASVLLWAPVLAFVIGGLR